MPRLSRAGHICSESSEGVRNKVKKDGRGCAHRAALGLGRSARIVLRR